MTNRITITLYGNESMIGFHTKTVMNENPPYHDNKPKRLSAFEKRLASVKGVQRADVYKYEVTIERGDAFDWNEIVPSILPIVAKFCRYDVYELRIEDKRPEHSYDDDGFRGARIHHPAIDLGVKPHNPYALNEPELADNLSALQPVAA